MRFAPLISLAVLAAGCPQPDPMFNGQWGDLNREVGALREDLTDADSDIAALQADLQAALDRISALETELAGDRLDGIEGDIGTLGTELDSAEASLALVAPLGTYVTVDAATHRISFVGANISIESGTANPNTGNLIIGEFNPDAEDTGSHNLILGSGHDFQASGAFIHGVGHVVTGNNAFASGDGHTISGAFGFAGGGEDNQLSAEHAVTIGGVDNDVLSEDGIAIGGTSNSIGTSLGLALGGEQNDVVGSVGCVIPAGLLNDGSMCTIDHRFALPPPTQ